MRCGSLRQIFLQQQRCRTSPPPSASWLRTRPGQYSKSLVLLAAEGLPRSQTTSVSFSLPWKRILVRLHHAEKCGSRDLGIAPVWYEVITGGVLRNCQEEG